MDIPDLEAEEDLSRRVAAAPAARSVSVMDIAELESEDLFRLPVLAKDHEVDLSLLTACLCPAVEVSRVVCSFQPDLTILAVHMCCILECMALRTCCLTVLGVIIFLQVAEELVPWDFELLLTEIASALNAEKELHTSKDDQQSAV